MKFLIPFAALFAAVTATAIPVEALDVSAPASDASLKEKRCWSSYTVYGCSRDPPIGTQLGSKGVYDEGPVNYGDWCPQWCGATYPTATWATLNPGTCSCGTGDITTIAPSQVAVPVRAPCTLSLPVQMEAVGAVVGTILPFIN
ncbi:hypothetical protein AA313_de0209808 [Arthrobotrys entomopaga]|nr:hypothetical protein AA313_de0209808 [Arthrobotrys entomopaga]